MTDNKTPKTGEEAHAILQALVTARPTGKSDVNHNTFSDTLLTIFAHDKRGDRFHGSTDPQWLTADCVKTICDIAKKAPDERLRLIAANELGWVGLREAHTDNVLKEITEILNNRQETSDVRAQALCAFDIIAQYAPQRADAVANTLAKFIADAGMESGLRVSAAVTILMSSRTVKLQNHFTGASVDSLVAAFANAAAPKIRHYTAALLLRALEGSEQHVAKIAPLAGEMEKTCAEYMKKANQERNSSPAP